MIALHLDHVRVDEAGVTLEVADAVAAQVLADARALGDGDRVLAGDQPRNGGVRIVEGDRDAVEIARAISAQIDRRLAERLARERAGVDRGAAGLRRLLDHGDPPAEVRSLRRALLAGGTAADHHQIERLLLGVRWAHGVSGSA
jgi:hypothetical protein